MTRKDKPEYKRVAITIPNTVNWRFNKVSLGVLTHKSWAEIPLKSTKQFIHCVYNGWKVSQQLRLRLVGRKVLVWLTFEKEVEVESRDGNYLSIDVNENNITVAIFEDFKLKELRRYETRLGKIVAKYSSFCNLLSVVSGNYVKKLKERAINALNIAKNTSYLNWKVFLAEQAVHLYVKVVYNELIGDKLRGHQIRGLIGQLALELEKNGFTEEVKKLKDFIVRNRDTLLLLEESYVGSRYSEEDLEEAFTNDAIKVVIELINLLEEVAKSVKLG